MYTSFTFGGVLFIDLNSSQSMVAGKPMYQYAQSLLTDPNVPNCVVGFFHEPAVTSNTTIASNESDIWKLMANNGVDLMVNGHQHNMIEYKPLDANFNAGTSQAHLVELVNGAGGHGLTGVTKVPPGARIAWSKGKTAGLLALTLNGAAGGSAATSIGWQWQDVNGNVLRSNSVDCGSNNRAPVVNAGPDRVDHPPEPGDDAGLGERRRTAEPSRDGHDRLVADERAGHRLHHRPRFADDHRELPDSGDLRAPADR